MTRHLLLLAALAGAATTAALPQRKIFAWAGPSNATIAQLTNASWSGIFDGVHAGAEPPHPTHSSWISQRHPRVAPGGGFSGCFVVATLFALFSEGSFPHLCCRLSQVSSPKTDDFPVVFSLKTVNFALKHDI